MVRKDFKCEFRQNKSKWNIQGIPSRHCMQLIAMLLYIINVLCPLDLAMSVDHTNRTWWLVDAYKLATVNNSSSNQDDATTTTVTSKWLRGLASFDLPLTITTGGPPVEHNTRSIRPHLPGDYDCLVSERTHAPS